MMPNDQVFYVGQKAFISKNGKVLALVHETGLDFPGGKIQEGKLDFLEELKREVREETGLEINGAEPFFTWSTQHQKTGNLIFLIGYKCEYASGEVIISDEHVGYRWVSPDDYSEVAEDSDYYKALQKYFNTTTRV
jgi:8-oxo-dGTP diphosphatase